MTKPPVFTGLDAAERMLVCLRDAGQVDDPSGKAVRVLGDRCGIAKLAATRIVRALEEDGLVVREVNATKTRTIALTPMGQRKAGVIETTFAPVDIAQPIAQPYTGNPLTRHLAPMPNGKGSSVEGPEPRLLRERSVPEQTPGPRSGDGGSIPPSRSTPLDRELDAIYLCMTAIECLEPDERERVVGYLVGRFGSNVAPAGAGAGA